MDVASSEFYQDGRYNLDFKAGTPNPDNVLTGEQLGELYQQMAR
jgi:enolase